MKNASVILPLLGFFVLSSCQAQDDGKAPLSNVTYEFPGTKVSQVQFASGLFIANGPNEISLSVGSGLRVESYNPDTGEAILVGMSDRGPNVDSPNLLNAPSGLTATKVFAISAHMSLIALFFLAPGGPSSALLRVCCSGVDRLARVLT